MLGARTSTSWEKRIVRVPCVEAYEPFAEFILESHDLEADHRSVFAGNAMAQE